jgi:putative flavoprotein involved in K+ transport
MRRTDVVVVGGGQAGLAMSRVLAERGIAHVVLERGRIGERWRSERWDSLRLLTPRWQSRLPGFAYRGPQPDGFMTKDELVTFLEDYARASRAPVERGVTVEAVAPAEGGYQVDTDRGGWLARSVVVATGHCHEARVPAWAARLPPDVLQVAPTRYRNPSQLPRGGVLVVGASATGVQLASELQRSGRPVTLAVSRHARMPRRYRGRDILWWYDALGLGEQRAEELPDLEAARAAPSLQLVGSPEHRTLDLATLRHEGVRLTGRAVGSDGERVLFADDLAASVRDADQRLARLLARIDAYVASRGIEAPPAEPVRPVQLAPAPAALDLRGEGIRTVLWATGYRRSYPWLRVPVLDARGELVHSGGVTPAAGLYALGLPLLRRRKSSWLDGVGDDARALGAHLADRLERRAA